MTLQEFTNRGQDYADLRDSLREIEELKATNAELLAACKEVKRWIEEDTLLNLDDLSEDASEILDMVRAVVAKARKEVS